MSDENSAVLIASYKERISALEAENKTLNAEAGKRRHTAKDLKAELEATKAELEEFKQGFQALDAEHTALKESASAAPEEKDKIIAGLQQQIRTRDHKEVFTRLAKTANVREDALNDLWDLSGYKAEGETADEATLSELITAKLKGRDYLLAPKVETTTAAADAATPNGTTKTAQPVITTPATKPGPGAARTTSDTSAPAVQTVLERVQRESARYLHPTKEGRL